MSERLPDAIRRYRSSGLPEDLEVVGGIAQRAGLEYELPADLFFALAATFPNSHYMGVIADFVIDTRDGVATTLARVYAGKENWFPDHEDQHTCPNGHDGVFEFANLGIDEIGTVDDVEDNTSYLGRRQLGDPWIGVIRCHYCRAAWPMGDVSESFR